MQCEGLLRRTYVQNRTTDRNCYGTMHWNRCRTPKMASMHTTGVSAKQGDTM